MSDAGKWMEDWMQSQQKYWQSWADMAQRAVKMPEAPKNPLAEGLNQWWQAIAPATPPAGQEVFGKLMDASRGYFTLAEKFMSETQGQKNGLEVIDGWLENMKKMWEGVSQAGHLFRPDPQFKGFNTFWDLPMDTWNRLAANVMPMPGDFTQAFHPEGADMVQEQVNRFLSIPAVGYTREAQEQHQILAQRQMEYAAATQAYQMAFGKLGVETTKTFQAALKARAEEGEPISSLRELYDQWVEMSEAAYADFVMGEEYQTLYGRLVNTLMKLKQQLARMVDQHLEAMNMPSRAEISTLQCRQQELRRENLRLRKELKEIQAQLLTMRGAMLQPGRTAAAPAAPVKRSVAKPSAQPAPRAAAKAKPKAKAPAKAAGRPATKLGKATASAAQRFAGKKKAR